MNAFVLLLVALIGAVVLLYTPRSLAAELPDTRADLFYSAYLLCLTGLMGMAITGDVFNLFVFLEIVLPVELHPHSPSGATGAP